MSLDDISSYDRLYTTCTSSLPTEPLLRALALCSSNPVDPCYGVDCGDHGQCADGSCQCESGYSGAVCEFGCLFPQYMATGKLALSTVVLSTLKNVIGRRRRGHRRHRRQLLSITPAMGGRP